MNVLRSIYHSGFAPALTPGVGSDGSAGVSAGEVDVGGGRLVLESSVVVLMPSGLRKTG